ncbi:MAG: hypothetical protein B1H11_10660 [Desulfobacteraceae bacterium 4484_190.1]|nr:MAG: hypothetical protein B1H11_10660 [Desulfobacteraceae bacterium 4484_190.1]
MKFQSLTKKHIQLLKDILSPERVSSGQSNLDLHSIDQSHHPPSRPDAVLWPINAQEVSDILAFASQENIPVTAWGSGSSLEGNPIPVFKGLVLDFTYMNRILQIREKDFQADVEPGVIYQRLNTRLKHTGLFFAPDPGAHATIGGIIANNAGGIRSVRYGSARQNVLQIKVVLANGEQITAGSRSLKTSSGYDLLDLFVGSEGTLGLITEATVRLRGLPERSVAAIVSFPSVKMAAKAVFDIIRSGLEPAALELMDTNCIRLINREDSIGINESPSLFIEFYGVAKAQLEQEMDMVREISRHAGTNGFVSGIGDRDRNALLKARYELGEKIRRSHPGRTHIVLDVAVPISSFPKTVSFAKQESSVTDIPFYIFGHAGSGNLHLVLMGKTDDPTEWAAIDRINESIVEMAIRQGGTATGEHGVGIGKKKFMFTEHGTGLKWMHNIKKLLDPQGILNPGKIFPLSK